MSIKIIELGNLAPSDSGSTQVGNAVCPGSAFVTRLDFETNDWRGFGGPRLNGLRVYCSGGTPPFAVHYLLSPISPESVLAQVQGQVVPNGIRDVFAYSDIYINMFGYGDSSAGQSKGTPWQQSASEAAGCLLKGVELSYVAWVDGMRLHFDCSAPSPSPPSTTPAPSTPPAPSSTTVGPPLSPSPPTTVTVIVPPPSPVMSTVVVGSGPNATTVTTVVMLTPTPVTITLPAGAASPAFVTQLVGGPASVTTILTHDPAGQHQQSHSDSPRWSLLMGLLAGVALVLAGIVLALLFLFIRQKRRQPVKPRDLPMVPAEQTAVPPGVDPPAYLATPIRRPDSVDVPFQVPPIADKKQDKVTDAVWVDVDLSEKPCAASSQAPR